MISNAYQYINFSIGQNSGVETPEELVPVKRTPYCIKPIAECSQINKGAFIPSVSGCLHTVDGLSAGLPEYNANNTWYFNGNNRVLNNNNRNNANFHARPCFDFHQYEYEFFRNPGDFMIFTATETDKQNEIVSVAELIELDNHCKNTKHACQEFNVERIHNIMLVYTQLNRKDIRIGEVRRFIMLKPKLREIIYCTYGIKLIQSFYSITIRYYLESDFLLPDSFSCREGKGVLRAVNTFRDYIKQESENFTVDIWLASVDIQNFFYSIDCRLAVDKILAYIDAHDIPNKELFVYLTKVLYLSYYQDFLIPPTKKTAKRSGLLKKEKTLLHNRPYKGVPIGNWPSQVIGNFLTTFPLLYLRAMGYKFIHYTDDSGIVVKDKEKWMKDIKLLDDFYKTELHLTLHPDKRYLQHYSKGIVLLGRKIKFNRVLPSNNTYNTVERFINIKIDLARKERSYIYENCEEFMQSFNSYMGLLIHMNTYRFRQKLIRRLKKSPWTMVLDFERKDYSKVNIKKKHTTKIRYKRWIRQRKNMLGSTSSMNLSSHQK